jgi:NADH-quinone oxidoreductase subunit G
MAEAKSPVVICGSGHTELTAIKNIIPLIAPPFAKGGLQAEIKLAFIMDGPNAFGCALLANEHDTLPLSRAIADKRVKGIISFEADLSDELLEGITVLGAADWWPTGVLARAEVALPACAWVEQDGTFVNNEGRAQRFMKVMQPGLPIRGLTPELHPPRVHRHDAPGGDVLPAWRIISDLLERLGGVRVDSPLDGSWKGLNCLEAEGPGELLNRPK